MNNGMIWIGSICAEDNSGKIESLEELCEYNSRAYISGGPEMMPICAGERRDIVQQKMDMVRERRRKEIADFEMAITECLSETMQDACIFVCPVAETADAGSREKDLLKIVSRRCGNGISLVVDVSHYYARYKALSNSSKEEALAGVADEIQIDISSFCTDVDG